MRSSEPRCGNESHQEPSAGNESHQEPRGGNESHQELKLCSDIFSGKL